MEKIEPEKPKLKNNEFSIAVDNLAYRFEIFIQKSGIFQTSFSLFVFGDLSFMWKHIFSSSHPYSK